MSYAYAFDVNFSLNILFFETITYWKVIFCRNVPWGVLFKICSQGSEILNIFRTGIEKLGKKLNVKKNFLLKSKCHWSTKTCFIIPKKYFLKFVRGNFLRLIFFLLQFQESMDILMLNNFFTIFLLLFTTVNTIFVLEQK
jgi:hypothetical protein